jgi:hypothetical protein
MGKVESLHALVNHIFPEKHAFFGLGGENSSIFLRLDAFRACTRPAADKPLD